MNTGTAQKKKQRGFNLIEAAIVLGVVGLVIGGIWGATSAIKKQHQTSQANSGVLSIVERTRHLFERNYPPSMTRLGASSGATPPLAFQLGIMNNLDGFQNRGSNIISPFEGVIMEVDLNHQDCSTKPTISIWFKGISPDDCINLTSSISSRFRDNSSLISIRLPFQGADAGCGNPAIPVIPTKTQCTGSHWLGFFFNP